MEQTKRDAVLELHRAGHSPGSITRLLNYHNRTVNRIIKRYLSTGEGTRKKHKPRSDRKRTPAFLAALNNAIQTSPGTSMRVHSKNFATSRHTISRAIRDDLGYKSYVLRVRHLLSEKQKQARVTKGTRLLNALKAAEAGSLRFFSDEKIFTLDRTANRRNDRWICKDPKDVPMVFRSKHPAAVMVLGVICSNGAVMPPHFFLPKQRVTKEVYLEVLQSVVKPWMDNVARGKRYTFQQDSAPAHKSNLVQSWLRRSLPDFWDAQTWPPSSPDLNPCDFYL